MLTALVAGAGRGTGLATARGFAKVPTLDEQGVKGAEADSWPAIFGPPGIPDATTSRLQQEISGALNDPLIKEPLAGVGLDAGAAAGDAAGRGEEVGRGVQALRRAGGLTWRGN